MSVNSCKREGLNSVPQQSFLVQRDAIMDLATKRALLVSIMGVYQVVGESTEFDRHLWYVYLLVQSLNQLCNGFRKGGDLIQLTYFVHICHIPGGENSLQYTHEGQVRADSY